MRSLNNFEDFLKSGVVKRITPDILRARSLVEEAEKRRNFINEMSSKIGLSDDNANYFIEHSYDTLLELIRAKLLIDGYKTSGEGAHAAEVAYMRVMNFPEAKVKFMNDLRFYRKGILYYGRKFDVMYGNKVLDFLAKTYPKLREITNSP